ncbi:caspase-6-like [Watersipora subatra]|uniref:caspase-6-like n=1 Tax=Watersipora subatra TaxID=2589382 RepID=UPI00355B3D16
MASKLSLQIQNILRKDISKDDNDVMDALRGILRDEFGFGRNELSKIGNNPLKMFDELSRKGIISKKESNYTNLTKLLNGAGLMEEADAIDSLINDYRQTQACDRPQNLTMRAVKREASFGSGEAVVGVAAKRRCYVSMGSQDSIVSPDGVIPSGLQFYLSHYSKNHNYNVDEGTKGLVGIINNFTSPRCKQLQRNGTLEDEDRIIRFFTSASFSNSYEISSARDLRKEDFLAQLDHLAEMLNPENSDFNRFFLFIMSHGDKGGVKSYYTKVEQADESVISMEEITSKFRKCLRGCPKVFVIQACQGEKDNTGEAVAADADRDTIQQPDELNGAANEEEVEADGAMTVTVPDAADTLVAFATIHGYRSYRGKERYGSWFIDILIKELEECHKTDKYFSSHLVDILTEVQNKVSSKKGSAVSADSSKRNEKVRVVQMPVFQSTLRKKFYLVPPVLPCER